jgi:hypothetical protein
MPGGSVSEQPPEQPEITDNPDGTQTVHARATLQAAVTTEPEGDG